MKYSVTFKKRMEGSSGNILVIRIFAIIAAIVATAALLLILGYSPAKIARVLQGIFISTFFSRYGIMDTLTKTIPLLLCAVAVSYAFRMKMWNIGAEGQLAIGAFAANAVALAFPDMPAVPLILLMIAAGMLAGAVWALLAALPRALMGVSETIMTLMLNYVALMLLQFMILCVWKDPAGKGFPIAPPISRNAWFPVIPGTYIHMGLLIGLIMTGVYAFVIGRTKWGFEVRTIGESPSAARYAGMNLTLNMLLVLGVSGAVAGLAGVSELAGIAHRLEMDISAGYGFTAVIIAWLARLNPLGVVVMSVFMAALLVGGGYVQILGIPYAVATLIQGIILFFVLGFDALTRYEIRIVRKEAAR
ncbi:MAG: ABC transporter permease [Christensenellales bacterium]|jgi:ABC-type uncharacterized transport system permease subunit